MFPVTGIGEVRAGDDLCDVLSEVLVATSPDKAVVPGGLRDGDVLVVTQKVVSKAEGRVVAIDDETDCEAQVGRE